MTEKRKEKRVKSEGIFVFLSLLSLLFALLSAPAAHARNAVIKLDKLERETKVERVDEKQLQDAVKRVAYNPEEVKFKNTMVHKSVGDFPVLCGEVNITSHEAGSKWQRFVYASKEPLLEEDKGFTRAWEKHCE